MCLNSILTAPKKQEKSIDSIDKRYYNTLVVSLNDTERG